MRTAAPAPLALVLLFGTALVAGGCAGAPDVIVDGPAFQAAGIRSIAVLPFVCAREGDADTLERLPEDEKKAARARLETIRRIFHHQLHTGRYLVQYLEDTDGDLRQHRIDAARLRPMTPALAALLCRVLAVDGVVLGEVSRFYNFEAAVIYRQAIQARLRLFAADGKEVAGIEHGVSSTGGILIESSQSVTAIQGTIDNGTDLGFLRLAERFGVAAARAFPPPAAPVPVERLLEAIRIETVTLAPSRSGSLSLGDTLDVEVRATPGLRGTIGLGSANRGVTLEELPGRPGVYRGFFRVTPGEWSSGPVRVVLRTRQGLSRTRSFDATIVEIDARLPAAPHALTLRPGRPARLTWAPPPDGLARRFAVYRLEKDGTFALVARVDGTEVEVDGGAHGYAVVGVNARGQIGRMAVALASGPADGGATPGIGR